MKTREGKKEETGERPRGRGVGWGEQEKRGTGEEGRGARGRDGEQGEERRGVGEGGRVATESWVGGRRRGAGGDGGGGGENIPFRGSFRGCNGDFSAHFFLHRIFLERRTVTRRPQ